MKALLEPIASLPDEGLMRMPEFLRYIPVSRATAYAKIRAGIWPSPLRISNRVVAFRNRDVRALLERFERGEA